MTLTIRDLSDLRARLDRLRPDDAAAAALATQAERLAQSVRDRLAELPGAGAHEEPWRRTGALHDSISSTAVDLNAAIGSNDPAAAPQELGTAHLPPRPFLAPTAAACGDGVAREIGRTVATAIRGNGP